MNRLPYKEPARSRSRRRPRAVAALLACLAPLLLASLLAPLAAFAARAPLPDAALAAASADEMPAEAMPVENRPAEDMAAEDRPAEIPPGGRDWSATGGEALGDALDDTPWYDAQKEELRPIKVGSELDLGSGLPGLPILGFLAQAGAYLLLAALLFGLVWLMIRAYLNREAAAVEHSSRVRALAAADRVEALPAPIEGDLGDLLTVARRLAAEGRYSEAVVYLYSHELVELDRHRHIRLAKGKTNRQYLRELAGQSDLRTLLATTVDRFERAFFGAERLDRTSFDVCLNDIPQFSTLVAQEPA